MSCRLRPPVTSPAAINAGSFGTLVAAVGVAGLVETLTSPGPFTVLAPTDDAFDALPGGLWGWIRCSVHAATKRHD
jgi:uncharacterized surface protein with fasciclin (FAS1) repeats